MKTTRRGFFGMMAVAAGAVVLRPEAKAAEKKDEHVEHGISLTVTSDRASIPGDVIEDSRGQVVGISMGDGNILVTGTATIEVNTYWEKTSFPFPPVT